MHDLTRILSEILDNHGLTHLEKLKVTSSGLDRSFTALDLWSQWFNSFGGSTVQLLKHRSIDDDHLSAFIEELIDNIRQKVSKYINEFLRSNLPNTGAINDLKEVITRLRDSAYTTIPVKPWVHILTTAATNPTKFLQKHSVHDLRLIELAEYLITDIKLAAIDFTTTPVVKIFDLGDNDLRGHKLIDDVTTPRELWAKCAVEYKGVIGKMCKSNDIHLDTNLAIAVLNVIRTTTVAFTQTSKRYIKPILSSKGLTSDEIDRIVISKGGDHRAHTDRELWAQWFISGLSLDEFFQERSITNLETRRFIKSLLT